MPNWCANHIEISGPKEKIQNLWDKVDETNNLLEHLCPLKKNRGREDAISGWGCKWDIDPCELALEYNKITGYFESPWSPPTIAVANFLSANPDCNIDLYYYEPAMDFAGSFHDGDIIISDQDKDFWINDEVGQMLDGHFGVYDHIEEYEEEVMTEVIATPPDVLINPED